MPEDLKPTMDVVEFFDLVYAKYKRYWYSQLGEGKSRHFVVLEHSRNWETLLEKLRDRPPGLALDLGAGEGTDAIKLALLGYEVDALEASSVGAEKIENFSRANRVRVNVLNQDVRLFQPTRKYDVVICNGLLHYIEDKPLILGKIDEATKAGGYNLVSLFSDYTPVPECHQVIPVYCDEEQGLIKSFYDGWQKLYSDVQRGRLDNSHLGFPDHHHSLIKIVAQKPGE